MLIITECLLRFVLWVTDKVDIVLTIEHRDEHLTSLLTTIEAEGSQKYLFRVFLGDFLIYNRYLQVLQLVNLVLRKIHVYNLNMLSLQELAGFGVQLIDFCLSKFQLSSSTFAILQKIDSIFAIIFVTILVLIELLDFNGIIVLLFWLQV